MPSKNLLKKILALFFLILFLNLGFIIFAREVYFNIENLIVLIAFNMILCIDISIRPISSEKDHFKYPKLSILLFLLLPFIVILPYLENWLVIQQNLTFWDNFFIYLIGISLLIIGGIILIYSRLLIGKFGSSKITIEEKHHLVIKGIYKHIRHPIYLGMILVFSGFALSFRSLILPIIFFFSFFILFKNRMDTEEKLLKERFGNDYELYLKRTKRLFPYIY